MFKHITLKLGNARKAEQYTIYPYNGEQSFLIQSDKRIARINMDGSGIVSNPHPSGAYGHHLAYEKNPVQLTPDQLMELKLTVLGEGEVMNYKNCIYSQQNLNGITL
jgi:hypothetical protein